MDLTDKTLIITGASSGIGAAAAQLFAAAGANVVLGARRGDALQKQVDAIAQSGGTATALPGDVTDEPYAQALVDHALDRFGRLDGAFNNAGMVGGISPLPDMQTAMWEEVIKTNLTSAFFAARAQIPALKANGSGVLVFTSSFVGYSNGGMPGMAAYAAAKAGLNGLVQSLAADHAADHIRVHSLMPGGTLTAMAGEDPQAHAFIADLHPMKRMADPVEIARVAQFLLCDQSSFMTGSPVLADGGMSIRLV